MSTVPLEVAPGRRGTERCYLRFRSCDRFWSQGSDACHQAARERKVGPDTLLTVQKFPQIH